MESVKSLFVAVGKLYNKSQPHYEACRALFTAAHSKLHRESTYSSYGCYAGNPVVPYHVFSLNPATVSRPVRPDIYISDPNELAIIHNEFMAVLKVPASSWTVENRVTANRIVYTAVMSVACCYDIWQRGSRKTPGTFFEFLMAGLLKMMFPTADFIKHIPLAAILHDKDVLESTAESQSQADDSENGDAAGVSTDLVIGVPNKRGGVVVPLKITTRERIVQPFAHQRILDSAFGDGVFKSLLVCISETQLDDKTKSVKQVCVPGTVKLFQKYLARVGGIYYCDVPQRYAAADMRSTINVRSIGDFFVDVSQALTDHDATQI
jgi:hypothetical protein